MVVEISPRLGRVALQFVSRDKHDLPKKPRPGQLMHLAKLQIPVYGANLRTDVSMEANETMQFL